MMALRFCAAVALVVLAATTTPSPVDYAPQLATLRLKELKKMMSDLGVVCSHCKTRDDAVKVLSELRDDAAASYLHAFFSSESAPTPSASPAPASATGSSCNSKKSGKGGKKATCEEATPAAAAETSRKAKRGKGDASDDAPPAAGVKSSGEEVGVKSSGGEGEEKAVKGGKKKAAEPTQHKAGKKAAKHGAAADEVGVEAVAVPEVSAAPMPAQSTEEGKPAAVESPSPAPSRSRKRSPKPVSPSPAVVHDAAAASPAAPEAEAQPSVEAVQAVPAEAQSTAVDASPA